jgi:hypothetical protein
MRADVQRALVELAERSAPLELRKKAHSTASAEPPPLPASGPPLPPPRAAAKSAEPTMEISARDFEPSHPKAALGMDESVRIPKRRSWLPWFALLVLGAIGLKVWLDRRAATGDQATAGAASSTAATEAGAAAPDAAVRSVDAGLPPRVRPPGSRRPLPPPRPGASALH